MAVSFTITAARRAEGYLELDFADGSGAQIPIQSDGAFGLPLDDDKDFLLRVLVARILRRDRALAGLGSLAGRTVTLDLAQAQPFTVT